MPTKIERLEERVNAIERHLKRIEEQLAILPPLTDPFHGWEKSLDEIDRQIVSLLLNEKNPLTSVQMSEKLGLNRVKVWRHLKKIHRVSKRVKGEPIVIYDPSLKAWTMNWDEFEFKIPEEKKKD